jgi:60 kDa SS-A/Ro ribonucleoprotein
VSYLTRAASTLENPPQTEPLNERQVQNSASGYSFAVDCWKRLDRFLILGSEGGSYYASEQKLTIDNLKAVKECAEKDGLRVVNRILEISRGGRAPKNDPALMALAYVAAKGDITARTSALANLPEIARIGTHLFHFVAYVRQFRGWGRGLRRAVAAWYTEKEPERLAEQVVKYQQRDGWSHKDIFRLRHIKFKGQYQAIAKWVVKGEVTKTTPAIIKGHVKLQETTKALDAAKLIKDYGLVRESVPTELLKDPIVWAALLEKMPMTAVIRNLGNMSKSGLLSPLSEAASTVCERLTDADLLKKARVHPIQILIAACTYGAGRGMLGHGEWKVVPQVVDALDDAFYLAFKNIEPTKKNFYLGIDVSGSMSSGSVAGTFLSPRTAAMAMAMVTARTESNYYMAGFQHKLIEIPVTAKTTLRDAIRITEGLPFGSTDCAAPILDALEKKMNVDTFVIYTDSETWCGATHPVKALQMYRQKTGIAAKLVVCGLVANQFSIADPNDAGMLDVVGFDASTPQIISQFALE